HDFQLGRRNCQQFLRESFLLPEDNVVFVDAGGQSRWPAGSRNKPANPFERAVGATVMLPIIPVVGTAAYDVPAPDWPRIPKARLDQLEKRIQERAAILIPRLISEQIGAAIARSIASLIWKW